MPDERGIHNRFRGILQWFFSATHPVAGNGGLHVETYLAYPV
jgi:hypothetical protein